VANPLALLLKVKDSFTRIAKALVDGDLAALRPFRSVLFDAIVLLDDALLTPMPFLFSILVTEA